MRFRDKTVFIIGGSSGIGMAMACKLAGQGAHVAIFARREDVLEQACAEIEKARRDGAQKISSFVCDAADGEQAQRVLRDAAEKIGAPDLLINSAGGATPQKFENVTGDDLARTLAVNVYSTWHPCQVLSPLMKARGSGTIVNVSSVAGLVGTYGYTDYSLAKFGIVGFSEALRAELKPHGVHVQVLCPPDTQTPGFDRENETKPPETAAISEGAKLMTAEAVASACLKQIGGKRFLILANSESRFIDFARRFLPRVVRSEMDKTVAKVRSGRG